MSSVAKAELGTLFSNVKQAVAIRATLTEVGHPQPPTPIQIENSITMGIVTNTMLPKATKAIYLHWLWGQEQQKYFHYIWQP